MSAKGPPEKTDFGSDESFCLKLSACCCGLDTWRIRRRGGANGQQTHQRFRVDGSREAGREGRADQAGRLRAWPCGKLTLDVTFVPWPPPPCDGREKKRAGGEVCGRRRPVRPNERGHQKGTAAGQGLVHTRQQRSAAPGASCGRSLRLPGSPGRWRTSRSTPAVGKGADDELGDGPIAGEVGCLEQQRGCPQRRRRALTEVISTNSTAMPAALAHCWRKAKRSKEDTWMAMMMV